MAVGMLGQIILPLVSIVQSKLTRKTTKKQDLGYLIECNYLGCYYKTYDAYAFIDHVGNRHYCEDCKSYVESLANHRVCAQAVRRIPTLLELETYSGPFKRIPGTLTYKSLKVNRIFTQPFLSIWSAYQGSKKEIEKFLEHRFQYNENFELTINILCSMRGEPLQQITDGFVVLVDEYNCNHLVELAFHIYQALYTKVWIVSGIELALSFQ